MLVLTGTGAAEELLLVLVQERVRAVGEEAQERLGAGLLAVLTAVCCILDAQSQPADSVLCSTVQRPKAEKGFRGRSCGLRLPENYYSELRQTAFKTLRFQHRSIPDRIFWKQED